MLSSIAITRRFLEGRNNSKKNCDTIITSTPIKKRIVQQMEMEWLSPVGENSNKSLSPQIPVQENTDPKKMTEATSVDKICLINQREPKIKEAKQLIIMDSDEEEMFWTNRNKRLKKEKPTLNENEQLSTNALRSTRKKKPRDKVESKSTKPIIEKTVNTELQNHEITPPKNTVNSGKAVVATKKPLKTKSQAAPVTAEKKVSKVRTIESKNISIDELSQDSDQLTLFDRLDKERTKMNEYDGSTVRRSNRKRCKPLEYWNGARMNINRDSITRIESHEHIYPRKKIPRKVQGSETEVEQNHRIATNSSDSVDTRKLKASVTKKNTKNKRMSILKSGTSIKSKANVRFSTIGTGTTINGPTSKISVKPDWMINFSGLRSVQQPLSDSENCLIFTGLKAATGIISSAIMRIPSKVVDHNRAPDLQHLIFCVMAGAVTVTIDEISVRMETYGHFFVPSGVSYSIENIKKKEAILSLFKVACNCTSNN